MDKLKRGRKPVTGKPRRTMRYVRLDEDEALAFDARCASIGKTTSAHLRDKVLQEIAAHAATSEHA